MILFANHIMCKYEILFEIFSLLMDLNGRSKRKYVLPKFLKRYSMFLRFAKIKFENKWLMTHHRYYYSPQNEYYVLKRFTKISIYRREIRPSFFELSYGVKSTLLDFPEITCLQDKSLEGIAFVQPRVCNNDGRQRRPGAVILLFRNLMQPSRVFGRAFESILRYRKSQSCIYPSSVSGRNDRRPAGGRNVFVCVCVLLGNPIMYSRGYNVSMSNLPIEK